MIKGKKMEGYPDFGHGMKDYWKLDKDGKIYSSHSRTNDSTDVGTANDSHILQHR